MINLKIILRSLLRQKLNTGIIIASLAIGMACLNLIAIFIERELNTDGFHRDKDRIYVVKGETKSGEAIGILSECGKGAAEYMRNNFSQVEDFCRIMQSYDSNPKIIVNNDTYFDKPVIYNTSKNFFQFFTYKLLTKNPGTVLEAMNSLVISEQLAHKYFGSTDAVGRVIRLEYESKKDPMIVTGVFRKPLDNSQFHFDMVRLLPEDWISTCYLKLRNHTDLPKLEELLKINKDKMEGIQVDFQGLYHLNSLHNEYFNGSKSWSIKIKSRDKNDLWITFFIGFIIMIIAIFNYLGLLYNNLLEKSKDYTIQRVNGATKSQLILNFMTENFMVIGLSFILSLLVMIWLAPFFNELTNTNITPEFIFRPKQIIVLSAIVVILLIITFLSVSFRIKTNPDLQLLKPGNIQLRKQSQSPVFHIFQLASSIILIIISVVILKQTRFITNKEIGMDKNVIELKIPFVAGIKRQTFKEDLLAVPSIVQVSAADGTPFNWGEYLKLKENGMNKELKTYCFLGDQNLISTLGIKIIEGEGFSNNRSTERFKVLVNESFAHLFPGKNLIGTILQDITRTDQTKKKRELTICGVVKDFQYSSLKSFIEPAVIRYDETGEKLLIKPSANQITQANQAISRLWKKYVPDYPLETETIGDQFELLHRENQNYLKLITACCFISIFLSMIGLFAISYRSSQYRTKEIGIRKVNGAKIHEILITLNKDFLKWIVIAFVIACPVAWYATHKWLESFAYKTALSWWIFALAGLITLIIVLLTVSWQSWKAATRNPVEALRYE